MQTLQELIQNLHVEIQENKIDNALDLLSSFDKYEGEDWQPITNPKRMNFNRLFCTRMKTSNWYSFIGMDTAKVVNMAI